MVFRDLLTIGGGTRRNPLAPTTDWSSAAFDVEQFRIGMNVELEHGLQDLLTNVTDSDPVVTGRIALAHLKEFSDYSTRLVRMEEDARRDHAG